MYANCQNSCVVQEIWVKEHDSDIRFSTRSGNMAVLRIRSKNTQYNPYLWQNHENSHVLQEIWVEEHDDDIKF